MKASARRASRRRSRPQTFSGATNAAGSANSIVSPYARVGDMPKLSESQEDAMMEDQFCDNTSITPLPGQQPQDQEGIAPRMSPPHFATTSVGAIFSVFSDSFEIPKGRPAQRYNTSVTNSEADDGDDDGVGEEGADDNISVLTDSSWMMDDEEDGEEDTNSQIAAVSVASESLTVATTTTDSTTIPTNNHHNQKFHHMDPPEPRKKRRRVLAVAHDNGLFKRRKRM